MLTRAELETPRTPEEMGALLNSFGNDREAYPDCVVLLRKGIAKDILEEYWPLFALARNLRACSAYLKPSSNPGPDGVVGLATGKKLYVQITVADQSDEVAWKRELLSQGKPVSIWTRKSRDPLTKEIVEEGPSWFAPENYFGKKVQDIVDAITRKLPKFYKGTHALLVSVDVRPLMERHNETCNWRQDLRDRVSELGFIPYSKLYVANNEEIIELTVARSH